MAQDPIQDLRKNIMAIGRLLWEKELVTGLNGNISARVDGDRLLLTAHGACLGLLTEQNILLVDLEGQVLENQEGSVSTEKLLHTEVYKNLAETAAIVHTHTPYANAYFLKNETLTPAIFESKFYLGEVKSIPQLTPSVTDTRPITEALKNNNIVVLRHHGVVAAGKDLFDCFLLIQALEDAIKVDDISRLYEREEKPKIKIEKSKIKNSNGKNKESQKYKLFSREQINKIVELVNNDSQVAELGAKTNMTMDLAVQFNETGQTYSFKFEKGRIAKVGNDSNVEFLITAPQSVWRSVFNREIDPFVATTQKKMNLRGDFAKISKWYAPCSRVFELWQQVPVE